MRYALSVPNAGPPGRLVKLAIAAEHSGWDAVFLWDHVQFFRAMQLDLHDPWVVLGAIAQATERVRLGAMVTPVARRRPQKFAKEIVTLDHLSGGRVNVGIGLGFPPEDEFAAFGEDPDDRVRSARTDEALDVVTRLWSGEPVAHRGSFYSVDAQLLPPPVQKPRPPVWIGCSWPNPRPIQRARKWEGLIPIGRDGQPLGPDAIAAIVTALGPVATGFDLVAAWAPGHNLQAFEEAGATWLVESRWPQGDWLAELEASAGRGPG